MTAEEIKVKPAEYRIGERALSTNPDTGLTGIYEWNGMCFILGRIGHMEEKTIISHVDAVQAARQVSLRHGLIQPCEQVEDKRIIRCPYMDTTGLRHCTNADGLLVKPGGGVECPLQRGDLKFIEIVDKRLNGHYNSNVVWSPKWARVGSLF